MAAFLLSTVLSTLVILQGFFVYVCQSCSPPEGWQPTTLVDDILMSESVLYGVVTNTYPDPRFAYGDRPSTSYAVELEVYCILKGPKTPLIVNITQGGYIPGHCTSSKFVVGSVYVVTANVHSEGDQGRFGLSVRQGEINATQENLNEIAKACGLNAVTRPEGSSSSIVCPVSVPDCQREPTPRQRPFPPIRAPVPVVDESSDYSEPGTAPKIKEKTDDKSSDGSAAVATVATTLTAAVALAFVIVV